ncbi:MAG: hypothetical protein A2094_01260 [Planctomycetes bacterium GWE2_41_14]|nr:MAG: hypothetical protein A2094_01260 [Planctomycetes bacterium GWE2_41_14]
MSPLAKGGIKGGVINNPSSIPCEGGKERGSLGCSYAALEMPYKPIGVAYIDDKAIRFDNNWKDITENILNYSKKTEG